MPGFPYVYFPIIFNLFHNMTYIYRVHRKIFRGPSTLLVLLYTQTLRRIARREMKYTTNNSTRKVNFKITLQTGSPDHREIN